jgi:hypothetical protein
MTRIDGFLITHRIKIPRTHKNGCIVKICKADAGYKNKNPHTKKAAGSDPAVILCGG